MNSVIEVVAVSLGSFSITEFVKTALPWPLQSAGKLAVQYVGVAALTLIFGVPVLGGIAAAGIAMFWHRSHRLLGALGDEHRTRVMAAAGVKPIGGRP